MKQAFIILGILLLSASIIFSQDHKLQLWEGKLPNSNDVKIIEKADTSDIIRIQQVDRPNIEVYLPSKKYMTGEAVVICPGGGYSIIAYHWEGIDVAKWFNSKGIAAIVLKYRLPHTANNVEGKLSPFLDAQRAMRITRFNADKWGIDPNKIGVMGFSAGGHLASTLGTHYSEDFFVTDKIDSVSARPDFMILMYPVITFREPYLHRGSREFLIGRTEDSKLIDYYSGELNITAETPPTFLIHADDDTVVPVENSLMFYKKLHENEIPVEMHIFPEGGHGFGLAIGKEGAEQWKELCFSWIKKITK